MKPILVLHIIVPHFLHIKIVRHSRESVKLLEEIGKLIIIIPTQPILPGHKSRTVTYSS